MRIMPVKIGGVVIDYPVGLAPLAGVSDETFRAICLEQGAGLVVTEMVSAKAVVYKNVNTGVLLRIGKNEHPSAVQLFGSDPDALAAAVEMIEEIPFDMVDFNMGCPVPKVVKNGEGSALMREPERAKSAIRAIVRATGKPVTVKMRSGFSAEQINAPLLARIAEDAGAKSVCVHARTREQYYAGHADWNVIAEVKKSVSIPVFGNGDVKDGPSAKAMLEETGCDGIMIGRAAMGDPWIFDRIRAYLDDGTIKEKPPREEIRAMILRHAQTLTAAKGEYAGIRQMRSHAAWYTAGMPHSAAMRREIHQAETLEDLRRCLDRIEP